MELEKAKKIILSYIDRYEYVNKSVRYDENGYKATLEKHIEAFNTVIGDLHALQNLVDEKNDEIDRLQKENEELKNIDLTTVYLKGVSDEKERWRNKIREKIDNRISTIENLLDEMVDKSIGCINVSYLSKKEKEKVILKRNCLTVQKVTLIDIKKDLLKEE